MGYIDKNLLPQEQIIFRTRKHLIIFLYPFVLAGISVLATIYMYHNALLAKLLWVPWFVAFVMGFVVWLNYITSDFAVTDKRVMMREGFFYRHSNEIRISTISQVNVDQSLIGQMLGYGTVSIKTFGAFDVYPIISKPVVFQKVVNAQIDKLQSRE